MYDKEKQEALERESDYKESAHIALLSGEGVPSDVAGPRTFADIVYDAQDSDKFIEALRELTNKPTEENAKALSEMLIKATEREVDDLFIWSEANE